MDITTFDENDNLDFKNHICLKLCLMGNLINLLIMEVRFESITYICSYFQCQCYKFLFKYV